jgi:hypothetical protein
MDQLARKYGVEEFYLPLQASHNASGVVSAFDRFHADHPEALWDYQPTSVRLMDVPAGEGNVAWMRWGGRGWGSADRGVFFSRKYLEDPQLLQTVFNVNQGLGWWASRGVETSPAEFVTTHELGHVLHVAAITRNGGSEIKGPMNKLAVLLRNTLDQHSGDPIWWRKNLSEYAGSDRTGREVVAEAYANATLSNTPRALAEEITGNLLEAYDSLKPKRF